PVLTDYVSPGFFDLFRLPRLSGRDVSWDDGLEKPAVALVSASLASALFPAGDAVGQHIGIAGPQRRDVEIIGVVADAPYGTLACIGVYGLLAYSVTARVREIGVRMALGAARRTVVWMIVRDGLAIAVPAVLIGAPCAWAGARLVRAQLYGITAGDSRTLLIA